MTLKRPPLAGGICPLCRWRNRGSHISAGTGTQAFAFLSCGLLSLCMCVCTCALTWGILAAVYIRRCLGWIVEYPPGKQGWGCLWGPNPLCLWVVGMLCVNLGECHSPPLTLGITAFQFLSLLSPSLQNKHPQAQTAHPAKAQMEPKLELISPVAKATGS